MSKMVCTSTMLSIAAILVINKDGKLPKYLLVDVLDK